MPSKRSRLSPTGRGNASATGATLQSSRSTRRSATSCSSVTVCASVSRLPGAPALNSTTRPARRTHSPGVTAGALPVNTKIAREARGSPSPSNSCTKKPLLVASVTAPCVTTRRPVNGLRVPRPWIA